MPLPACPACARFVIFLIVAEFGGVLLCKFRLPVSSQRFDGGRKTGLTRRAGQRVVNLSRERGSAEEWPVILCAVAKKLGRFPSPPPKRDLRVPAAYLGFLAETVDFAISPLPGCRQLSAASGADDKVNAWRRICDQVLTGARGPQWFHRDSADFVGVVSAQLFHRIGGHKLPINVGPSVAAQLLDIRNIVSGRRIEINQWSMDSPHPECREFYGVVTRNVDRARKHMALEQARLRVGAGVDIRHEKGNIAHDPSDAELVPQVQGENPAAHSLFPTLESRRNIEKKEGNTE